MGKNLKRARRVLLSTGLAIAALIGSTPGTAQAVDVARETSIPATPFGWAAGESVQRCAGAIDATGTGGAGIGRLVDMGNGYYTFVLQLNVDFLDRFSPALTSLGYRVTYSVNGQQAKGLFAGDVKVRPGSAVIHSRQRIQGRAYTYAGTRKKGVINAGDILRLGIMDFLIDLATSQIVLVHGSITCQV